MDKQTKIDSVAEITESLAKAQSLIVADYRGLKVSEVNEIRAEIRKNDCFYRVLKNTLVKRAITGTPMEGLSDVLSGPTVIAYSFEDPVQPAKIIDKFEDTFEKLEVKGGYLDGQVLDAAGVKNLARMKGKDELRADFLAQLQAPAQSFVRLMAAAPTNFLYLLQAKGRAA